jgi:hypothetical protein
MLEDEEAQLLFFLEWLIAAALNTVVEIDEIPDNRVLH